MTISELIRLKESEDKVEFKEAKSQFSYNRGKKSILGYVTALANEKGGYLVLGVKESSPHEICGSAAWRDLEGKLELSKEEPKIGERYIIKELELVLLSLQGNKTKIGTLEKDLSVSLNRNQVKYLLQKLHEDEIVKTEGTGKGNRYSVTKDYEDLRDESLISAILHNLKEKYK